MEKSFTAPHVVHAPAGTPTENPDGRSFIGGRAPEFSKSKLQEPAQLEQQKEKPKEETAAEKCPACSSDLGVNFVFCAQCGMTLGRKNLPSSIGIKLDTNDVSEYLFKGYLSKEVELVHGKKALFKTLLPFEADEADTRLMQEFKDKEATNAQVTNKTAMIYLAYGWVKFDGQSLGETVDDRYNRLMRNMGPHLVDIASKKWNLFNRSVTAMLEDPDVIKNS